MNIKMYTAAREATTRARNVASAIQQVTRQVNDDNKDVSEKVDKNQQIRSKRKAELELAAAQNAKELAQKQAAITKVQSMVGFLQAVVASVAGVIGHEQDKKDKASGANKGRNSTNSTATTSTTAPTAPTII